MSEDLRAVLILLGGFTAISAGVCYVTYLLGGYDPPKPAE
jgi:hypothetical protein